MEIQTDYFKQKNDIMKLCIENPNPTVVNALDALRETNYILTDNGKRQLLDYEQAKHIIYDWRNVNLTPWAPKEIF